jgi:hypothetical protein
MDRNNTSYSLKVAKYLRDFLSAQGNPDQAALRYYQSIAVEFFRSGYASRGLLIYHKVGYGKTLTMLACADAHKRLSPSESETHEIIIITPKKLKSNVDKELAKYRKLFPDSTLSVEDFTFETLSSSLERKLKETLIKLNRLDTFDGLLLIVDEAHLLFRMISNGSKAAIYFYDKIMQSPKVRLLFLTGTPVTNEVFQLAPCFNMLGEAPPIFPENKELFERYFIGEGDLINESMFMNRISGLVSFAGYQSKERDPKFPTELPTENVRVTMTHRQTQAYSVLRDIERAESSKKSAKSTGSYVKFGKNSGSSSYKSGSRQMSNYCPPQEIINKLGMLDRTVKRAEKEDFSPEMLVPLTADELSSPKFLAIVRIARENSGLGCVYSEFVGLGGIAPLAEFLRKTGWVEWTPMSDAADASVGAGKRCFTIIYADTDSAAMLAEINKRDTRVNLILLTKTAGQGLDIKRLRWAIELSTLFTPSEEEQLKGRGLRYESHIDLPLDQQNFKLIRLIAVPDASFRYEEASSDEQVLEGCLRKMKLANKISKLMARAAIECSIVREHPEIDWPENHDCRICAPTNNKLFTHTFDIIADLDVDSQSADPCELYDEQDVEATRITVEGKEYYIVEDPQIYPAFRLYQRSDELGRFVEVPRDSETFERVSHLK